MRLFFVVTSLVLTFTFFAEALFGQECRRHVWTDIEISEQPCVRVYRTVYPSDYICCGVFGIPARNFHYWDYDMTHVYWIPPAALFPAVPGHEEDIKKEFNIPCYPGEAEEADNIPVLKEKTKDYSDKEITDVF